MRKLFLLIMALALLAAACGGDGTAASTTTAEQPETVLTTAAAQSGEEASTTTPAATTAAESTTATAPVKAAENPLDSALLQTGAATSGRTEGSFNIIGAEGAPAGTALSITFAGAFDTSQGAFSFSMDLGEALAASGASDLPPGFEGLLGEMEVRTIGDTSYMRFPLFSSLLGVDTEWISLPADEAGTAASGFGASPTNPADLLAAFEGVDADIEEVGREQIRGVDTTHYRFTVNADAVVSASDALATVPAGGALPVDMWIDDDGLVRRFSFDVDGTTAGPDAGFESMTMVWEMYDYGADVGIVAPPPNQVSDGSALGSIFGP